MSMENVIALAAATAILVAIPGPNVALTVANSLRHGLPAGVVTVLGTTTGVALQLVLVIGGMAAVIEVTAAALDWIKWLGVAYLLLLGIRTWREPAEDLAGVRAQSSHSLFRRGLLLAVINPKVLLFSAAFLPQFVGDGDPLVELAVLTVVYLGVILLGDLAWAVFASSARRALARYGRLRNRLTGLFLVGASVGLALTRRNA